MDEYLLSSEKGGFSLIQLIELSGLSVAQIVYELYPLSCYKRVAVCCGPGNNGGDGLAAARHLAHFGYSVSLYYPIEPKKEIYSVSRKHWLVYYPGNLKSLEAIIDPMQMCGCLLIARRSSR